MSTLELFQPGKGSVSCQPMADEQNRIGDPGMAERIKIALDQAGKAQRQVAMDVGVSAQSVTKWKRHGYMDRKNIPSFCRACNVSIEWMLTGDGSMRPENPLQSLSAESLVNLILETLSPGERADLLAALAVSASQELSGSG